MKKYNWIVALLLNVVTLNIYSIVLWTITTSDHNKLAGKYEKNTIMGFIPTFLLGFITCNIWPIIWYYKYSKQAVELAEAKGIELKISQSPVVLWLLTFVPVLSFYVWIENHNLLVEGEEA